MRPLVVRPSRRGPPGRVRKGRRRRVARRVLAVLAVSLATASVVGGGAASATGRAGLRFGIYPGGSAGTGSAATASDTALGLSAVEALRPGPTRQGQRPFVVHLYDAFTDQPGVDAFGGTGANGKVNSEIGRFGRHGLLVELVLRYEPVPGSPGDHVAAFAAFVRKAVTFYATDVKVAFLQVTNEANVLGSPQSSDGAYPGAWEALVAGVEAARSRARQLQSSMQIGFNWADGQSRVENRSFWSYLRSKGARWRTSVQWVGLDVYPGSFSEVSIPPSATGSAVVRAVVQLRRLAALGGLGGSIPLHISEVGYPTGPSRSYQDQVIALRSMIGALFRVRLRYDITDVRWFDLRDADTAAASLQDHYGLMTSGYVRKPAFLAYRQLVDRLSVTMSPPSDG